VLVWLCQGCPRQAMVAALGLDERTLGHGQASIAHRGMDRLSNKAGST
jgi:hypothetical protein